MSLSSAKFLHLSHLRGLKGCQKVAAVCYRVGDRGIEFLLVQTRNGRWTFPKGSAEPGLTHAQAAALEAFEEAGVHGRMEEAAFTRYTRRRGDSTRRAAARSGNELAVNAHLCEVVRLDPPQEKDRNPTWFSAPHAKQRLRERRKPDYGAELASVVDHAVHRIQRFHTEPGPGPNGSHADALQRVQFESVEATGVYGRMKEASLHLRGRRDGLGNSAAVEVAVNAYLCEVLRLGPPQSPPPRPTWVPTEKAKRLLAEYSETATVTDGPQRDPLRGSQITEIDHTRRTTAGARTPATRALRPERQPRD
ncbi:MAG: NUDIX domain-containing protein [Acidobacteriia bacterium]|nr:NUDIX domain-containing protein [Terriglobia bacterium]